MTTLLANADTLALFNQAKELAQVRDSAGNLIGFFAPAGSFDLPVKTVPGKVYTTREVFEHLKALTPDEKMRAYLDRKIEEVKARDECVEP